jgi:hypothetical protein
MGSLAESAARRRQEKLDEVQLQIERGSLTVRAMTPEERKLYPPRTATPLRKRWRS